MGLEHPSAPMAVNWLLSWVWRAQPDEKRPSRVVSVRLQPAGVVASFFPPEYLKATDVPRVVEALFGLHLKPSQTLLFTDWQTGKAVHDLLHGRLDVTVFTPTEKTEAVTKGIKAEEALKKVVVTPELEAVRRLYPDAALKGFFVDLKAHLLATVVANGSMGVNAMFLHMGDSFKDNNDALNRVPCNVMALELDRALMGLVHNRVFEEYVAAPSGALLYRVV